MNLVNTKVRYKHKGTALRGARILLEKLQKRIDDNPDQFCENYGQNEIRDFEDTLSDLNYSDKCDIMETLYRVDRMTPNK